jgi:hypothetical protein
MAKAAGAAINIKTMARRMRVVLFFSGIDWSI